MGLSVGIAGLPNVGKSTLLNALTHAGAEASNYPFCTIEKNVAMAVVPDPDLTRLGEILAPEETLASTIRFVDIAGLVEGASKGEGLGNKFLGHIREVDAILHVVRCFSNEDVVHSTGQPDPVRDVGIVETELLLADLETAERALAKLTSASQRGKKEAESSLAAFEHAVRVLGEGTPIRDVELPAAEQQVLAETRFLTAKPCLYIANTDEDDPEGNGPSVSQLREAKGAECVVPVSIQIEEEIAELPADEQAEFLAGLDLERSALELVVPACARLLDLITFYTIANDKLQAWQLPRGGTAAEAAAQIHSDMEKGFIRAEVMALGDLVRLGSRHELHDHGLIHTVGRDYAVQDKDVLQILFKV